MTEDEAKTKWCPQAIVNNGSGYNANREWEGKHDSVYLKRSRCIASTCMAWRDVVVMREKRNAPLGVQERVVTGGYCGLAGVPA